MLELVPIGFWGVPSAGETTCFAVRGEGFTLLIDVGTSPVAQLAAANQRLTDITHIFLSHSHADHLQGFASLVFSRTLQERATGKAAPLQILGTDSMLATCKSLLALFYPDRKFELVWVPLVGSEPVALTPTVTVKPFRAAHTVESTGIRIAVANENVLAFTSDTALTEEISGNCTGVGTLLGECFGTKADFDQVMTAQRHMSAEDVGQLASTARVRQLVLFHMHAPYRQEAKRAEMLRIIADRFGGKIIFPEAGKPIPL